MRRFATTCLVVLGLAWLPASVAQDADEAPRDPVLVTVLGAVARPGPVALVDTQATVDRAFALLGGARADAYRFATLLLRTVAETPPRFPCVSPGARHAALLMGDDPALSGEHAIIAALLDGRMQRMPAYSRPFGRLGSDRGDTTILRSGDVLALPQRSGRIHVVVADGGVESAAHQPELMAGDYLDQLPANRLARRRDYVLHYPDGRVAELALEAWNAEPAAVPPGSMLAPAAGCLPVPD